MADVAAQARVSVPTVSRVLSGVARVSPERRERVLEAVAALNFRPSAAARTLASSRAEAVAVIASNTSTYGYAETLRGIERGCRTAGLSVIISVVDSDSEEEVRRVTSTALSHSILGAVVLKFDPPGVAALATLPTGVPVVAVSGVRDTSVPQALLDEARAAEELTRHLLDLGHATVHHVRVPPSRREDGRTTGWRRALRAAGAPVPEMHDATWEPSSGRLLAPTLAADPSLTAVFCGNDEIAMGVVRGLNDLGVRVPEDISVVGFDDHPLSELWSPALTTVRQDFADLGERAVALLLESLSGQARPKAMSSARPELVVRESSAAPNPLRTPQ